MEGRYWFVSVPCDKDDEEETLINVRSNTTKVHSYASSVTKAGIPEDLRISSYDSLISLTDELPKIDSYILNVVNRIAKTWTDLIREEEKEPDEGNPSDGSAADATVEKPKKAKKAKKHDKDGKKKDKNALKVYGKYYADYLTQFSWNSVKYPQTMIINEMVTTMNSDASKREAQLKNQTSQVSELKSKLVAFSRSELGSLSVRDLSGIIEKHEIQVDISENLRTVFVAVPKQATKDFEKKWSDLTDEELRKKGEADEEWIELRSSFIVPGTLKKLEEDDEFNLYSMVIFKFIKDNFVQKCREERYVFREIATNVTEKRQETNDEIKKIQDEVEAKRNRLKRWCSTNFEAAFADLIHFKAIRLFVEAKLRFGADAVLLHLVMRPVKKSEKKLKKMLHRLFSDLDDPEGVGKSSGDIDERERMLTSQTGVDFLPFVFFSLDLGQRF